MTGLALAGTIILVVISLAILAVQFLFPQHKVKSASKDKDFTKNTLNVDDFERLKHEFK